MKELSRRKFLKLAGTASVSAGAVVYSGCAAWDAGFTAYDKMDFMRDKAPGMDRVQCSHTLCRYYRSPIEKGEPDENGYCGSKVFQLDR